MQQQRWKTSLYSRWRFDNSKDKWITNSIRWKTTNDSKWRIGYSKSIRITRSWIEIINNFDGLLTMAKINGLQTALDGKQSTLTAGTNITIANDGTISSTGGLSTEDITGAASTIVTRNLSGAKALMTSASGKVATSTVTSLELGYLSGTTSSIQTQLDGKQGSLTAGTNINIVGTTINAEADTNLVKLGNVEYTDNINKTSVHPYHGSGSTVGYFINGKESPILTFTSGKTYKFLVNDATNTGHPIKFYLDVDKTTEYTTGVFVSGTAGQDNAYVQIQVTDSTPTKLFYQCGSHSKMGNYLIVKGYANIQDGGLSIAKTNGLQTALDGKQSTIENGDLSITHVSGLQAALNSKISSIDDGSLTTADHGLQTALDSKISIAGGTFTNTPLAPTHQQIQIIQH